MTLDLRLSDSIFDLIEGSFDLAIRNSPLADTSLKGRKLADDRRVLCASPDYLARNGTPAHPDDLTGHQLIAFKHQSARPLTGPDGAAGEFDPRRSRSRLILDDGLTQKLATVAGAGISINSLWSVHQDLQSGTLVQVLPGYEVADKSVLWLVYPKANVLSPKVRAFMDFLIERIGKAPAWETPADAA